MTEFDTVQIIALLGWLVLVGSALTARRVSLKKGITLGLAWAAIFVGVSLVISQLVQ